LSSVEHRLIETAAVIRQEEESAYIGYQHGILCQVGLPRKKTEGRVFQRTFKKASVLVRAGDLWDGEKWVEQPLPYGPKPRLAMIYINSEAVRTQNPQIEIGSSCAEFLRRIGLPDHDGRTYNLFKRQMMSLSATELSLGFTVHNEAVTLNARPVKEFRAWISHDQPSLWPGELTLTNDYFGSLIEHAVPLDPRALGALSHSALALDWYCFLGRRLYELERAIKIPFVSLLEQFGQEYRGKHSYLDFKKELLATNRQVLAVYPDAKIEQVNGGLVLYPSHPPIRSKIKVRIKSKGPPKVLPPAVRSGSLAEKTIEQFRTLFPRLDPYSCQGDFDAWIQRKEEPNDYQRAFLGFARKWGKGKN